MAILKRLRNLDVCAVGLWVVLLSFGLVIPLYAEVSSYPLSGILNQTIIEPCHAAAVEKCMDTANLIQAIGGFYQTVIVVLVAALAGVVSLVYLSIRASSKRQIDEQFEKDFDAPWFKSRMKEQVNSAVSASLSEMQRKIEVIESALANKNVCDDSEEGVADQKVVDGGENNGPRKES